MPRLKTYRSDLSREAHEALWASHVKNAAWRKVIKAREARPEMIGARWLKAPPLESEEARLPISRCVCESNEMCVQVYRATEFNRRRSPGFVDAETGLWHDEADPWRVPAWVQKKAAAIEATCPAAIHYPSLLLEEAAGNSGASLDERDEEKRDAMEEGWLSNMLHDPRAERFRDPLTQEDSERRREAFIEAKAKERRDELCRLLEAQGFDPWDAKVVERVRLKIAEKARGRSFESAAHHQLRAYSACIWALRKRVEVEDEVMYETA